MTDLAMLGLALLTFLAFGLGWLTGRVRGEEWHDAGRSLPTSRDVSLPLRMRQKRGRS